MSEISQAQLGELLAGPGNHEGKAILTLAMDQGVEYGYGDLWRLVANRSEDQALVQPSSPTAWCKWSLEPSGVVERTNTAPRRFALTEHTGSYGQSLAGLLLPLGERYNKPLTSLWGERGSHGTIRSPLARFLIASCLLGTQAPMTPGQIAEETCLGYQFVTEQAHTMQSDGLLVHKQRDHNSQDVKFSLANREHAVQASANSSTVRAIEYLREHGSATLTELEAFCWAALTKRAQNATDSTKFRNNLTNALTAMHRRGMLSRERTRENSVLLTDEQRALWSDVLTHLKSFMNGDKSVIDTYKAQGKSFIANPTAVSRALMRARETQKKVPGRSQLPVLVQELVSSAAKPLSAREITETILEQRERVTAHAVRAILRQLVASNNVIRYQRKNTYLFGPAKKQEPKA